jgi:hypothetical protein
MPVTATTAQEKVVKFVQELLLDEDEKLAITPASIESKIALVLDMQPRWGEGLNHDAVVDELVRRFSLWIGQDSTIRSDVGHVPWLSATRKSDWRYWQRYREWLERKLSFKSVDALDKSTDHILGMLEDPVREGRWDRRGLVVGHVQSGKTGNYTGLICKAADAGYKIVIVLAGLHNNLRSQTQMRLDEGFLGYETKPLADDITVIGVGEIDGDPRIRPNYATNRTNSGDFNRAIARNLGITPEQRPWLFVVKKNKSVLQFLLTWIRNHVANTQDQQTGRKIVTNLPLLLIDDEADHASVDTQEQVFDADGMPDEDHQPTAINSLVRKILHAFARSAYVGYTATPFANIFIHERAETREEGPDLFPASFIINLAAPSNYIGPARVFGNTTRDGRLGGLPLLRPVDDYTDKDGPSGWMPPSHKSSHTPMFGGLDELPPSLREAIDAFIVACAIRQLRGQEHEHSSMLVHVTRFVAVQQQVQRQVDDYLRHMKQRLLRRVDHESIIAQLQQIHATDFAVTTGTIRTAEPELGIPEIPDWPSIEGVLPLILSEIEVRMINGTARDVLDYSDRSPSGLKVIAIGGDKLARGLTLEGLCVSYFLRATRMYDTLMQMGRWFGYRPGYLDLCRLYTTAELTDWFSHIADAGEELRREFDLMAESGATPRDYGLRVQSHPVLMVTSRLKMRTARNLMLSFSGQLVETVAFYRDRTRVQRNLDGFLQLVAKLSDPEVDPIRLRDGARQQWTGYLWNNVPAEHIVEFLLGYDTHPEAYKVNSRLLAEFISSMWKDRELTHWTVAVIGGGEGAVLPIGDGLAVDMLKRTANTPHEDRYSIGRLLSSRDEAIDLDESAWSAALELTRQAWKPDPARNGSDKPPDAPNGPAIRRIRGSGKDAVPAHRERGVLLLYALDPAEAKADFPSDTPPVIAFGISFPFSTSGTKVEYKVNNVLWEQEYGPAE